MHTEQHSAPSPQSKVSRLKRLGTRRLARAHVTLSERPQVAILGRQVLSIICEALVRELGGSVSGTGRLAETVVIPVTGLAHTAAFVLLDLSVTGGCAVLELELPVLFAALERLAGSGQRPSPVTRLTRLEEATFAFLVLSALAALRARSEIHPRLGARLAGVTMNRAEALSRLDARRPHLSVELSLSVGDVSAGGRLVLPAVIFESAWKDLLVERDSSIAPEVLAACIGAWCFLGSARLSPSSLRTLSAGDVVVFQARHGGDQLLGHGRLVTRGFQLVGEFTPEGFSLTRARRRALPLESNMAPVNEQSGGMPPLPVDVEIELTRLMLPLSELAALKPGSLLPLRINASEPVLLRIGDRAVARAELVDIDGEVGARILNLLP
ncbi:type III secretion system cytoplasmic ring protein SctQ [Hyalangium sp.]|uniref:type III secretion system cytoplasmic ring protein SctQ n=1 Tax=Hyalangium sp. TaxID=2028555 RepID=UPI002D60EBBE|nr:type III secretion system cytoplasmic ring protein SctQ [Hyalangium sp.]HYH95742.1 type III secretion system cytoplasmic ring protein SctQ [Hyalangium sp.]